MGNYQKASAKDEVEDGDVGVKRVKVKKDEDEGEDSEVEFLGERVTVGRY